MGKQDASFLFLDESYCEKWTNISALVGVMVPTGECATLISQFYAVMRSFIQPQPNVIARPPEVHGYVLPGETDDEKVRTVWDVVDLVSASCMKVYRVGYYITPAIREAFSNDEMMLGSCWFSMQFMLAPQLAKHVVIPIMDGFGERHIRRFSESGLYCDLMRAVGHGSSVSVRHSENLCDVMYADSRYSVFAQVADIVAYLRKISDMVADGHALPPFKQRLVELARKLDGAMEREEVVALSLNGSIQGPVHRAQAPGGEDSPLTCAFRIVSSDT
jgi:hypothetical protein